MPKQVSYIKDYNESIKWIYNLWRFGSKLGLDNIRQLLKEMGNPQNDFDSILITGTNGKGSTTALTASILNETGHSVGMYTSPHLQSFTERISINRRPIFHKDVVRILEEIKPIARKMEENPNLRHPTFFEVVTAIGFKYFSENCVDFAVLEVGMGGKLDATNVVQALVSIITNVSLEHTKVLGGTILEIAEKKAGIIKRGGILITATEDDQVFDLFKTICDKNDSRIFRVGYDIKYKKINSYLKGQYFNVEGLKNKYDDLFINLLGAHQLKNSATAIGAVEALSFYGINVPSESIRKGLEKTRWPGRFEIVQKSPLVVLDCAKDVEAIKAFIDCIRNDFKYNELIAVVSISEDKNIPEIIRHLSKVVDHFILTAHNVMRRATKPSILAEEVENNSKTYEIIENVKEAVSKARELATPSDMVVILGSIFLIGEAREIWHKTLNLDLII
ncbi:MAG: bifunctional folylpolyglutamate synthase/dihydrofolate synthase [Promethearchaeota archaeon]